MLKKEFIFGFYPLEALLKNAPERILQIYSQEGRQDKRLQTILDLAEYAHIPVQTVSKAQLDKWARHAHHQGLLAQAKRSVTLEEKDLLSMVDHRLHIKSDYLSDSILSAVNQAQALPIKQNNQPLFLLLLDGIQDPRNLGACLRVANAAGVDAVVITQDRATGITPVVRKVAAGAAETTPIITVTNLANTLRTLKKAGMWIYGLDQSAHQLVTQTSLLGPIGLVLGAEGKGLRHLTKMHCDCLLAIPMLGSVSSLNVSVAAGICLFEAVRQRQRNKL